MGRWRDNGERRYYDTTPLIKRVFTWFVWLGGWTHPWNDRDGKRYGTYFSTHYPDGMRAGPTPISLLGHTITFYGWGWQVRFWLRPRLYFVWSGYRKGLPIHVYISRNGTPPRPGERGIRIWPRADYYWH